jgi:starch synthase
MDKKLKVLFIASELTPIIKVGGLGDVAGTLPKYLKPYIDIEILLPDYKSIKEKLEFIPNSDVKINYIDIPEYFSSRDNIYGYPDDPIRFAAFCREVVNKIEKKEFGDVDIVHINDYHTALIPILLKDRELDNIKTIQSIHNLGPAYQGRYSLDLLNILELRHQHLTIEFDKYDNEINPLLQGILNSDIVSTVSPTYAKEILTKEYGGDLNDFLELRKNELYGILNGIDYSIFNPEVDITIYSKYNRDNYKIGKLENKKKLYEELHLNFNSDYPLFSFISRLDYQKGIDILISSIKTLKNKNIHFLILGTGAKDFENELQTLNTQDKNMFAIIDFNTVLANKMYAASDALIIPSRYEPSGLTQMIAMKYGTLPIVRSTGGLHDSVFNMTTGFTFENYSALDLTNVLNEANSLYKSKGWDEMIENAMQQDFSWHNSSQRYLVLYNKMKSN